MILIIGGANIDYHGRSSNPVHMHSSNPGVFTRSWGGVGRNIAENLALLGANPVFLGAVGDDAEAGLLAADLTRLGISTTHLLRVPGGRTSVYCEILDTQGDLVVAISDMEICLSLTPEELDLRLDLLRSASMVVVDTNLPQQTLEYLGGLGDLRLFADPVSVSKAPRLGGILPKLYGCKPNKAEAQALLDTVPGNPRHATATTRDLALGLRDHGIQQVWVSDGPQGVYYAGTEGDGHYPAEWDQAPLQEPPGQLPGDAPLQHDDAPLQRSPPLQHDDAPLQRSSLRGNTTGAGDAYTAGLVWALDRGLTAQRASEIAGRIAALTCEVETTTNPLLKILRNQL